MNFNGKVHQRKRVEDDIIPLTSITSDFDRRLHRYGNKILSYNHDDLELSRPYMGVMVLDGDLNVLGEHLFAQFEVFSQRNHFVGENGLYLSMNNVFNPEYNEDKLRYLIFTPELENR